MKSLFIVFFAFAFTLKSYCQSVCQTGGENATLTFTAPAGMVFVSVTFASYGTPNGSCGAFTIGGCHAANSTTIVEAALIGQNSATIVADNTTFGDPCGGTVKRLYIEAVYSLALPLELLSFSCFAAGNNNVLQWETANEVNTQGFIIERSVDGVQFSAIGKRTSNNRLENNKYNYTDNLFTNGYSFYRLKMIDSDGRYEYSKIITVKNKSNNKFHISPNPAAGIINVSRLNGEGLIELTNMQGNVLQRINVSGQALKIDLTPHPPGMYFIKYAGKEGTTMQKIMKQ